MSMKVISPANPIMFRQLFNSRWCALSMCKAVGLTHACLQQACLPFSGRVLCSKGSQQPVVHYVYMSSGGTPVLFPMLLTFLLSDNNSVDF